MSADALPATIADGAFSAVLKNGHRPGGTGPVSATVTLAWRALLKIKHVPFQLFDVTAFPIMMTLMFTFLFGGALMGSVDAYVQWVIPGILVQAVIFITVYTGVGINTDISKGIHDRFRSLPIWQPAPVLGALLGDVLRYLVACTVVVTLGLAIGLRPGGGALGVVMAVGLVLILCFSVSWIWIVISLKVKTPESVMTTSFLVLFPITFISNIFVEVDKMPTWLQPVVNSNPVTHLVTASRGLIHGTDVGGNVMWVLIAAGVITAVFAPLALHMYRRER